MPSTLRADTLPSQAKNLARGMLRGETPSKFLGSRPIGPVLERCFQLSRMTKDQAARDMDYTDASTVSKWISGDVPFNFARLWAAKKLRAGFIAALAEDAESQVEITQTITIRRLA
jgi:hypothetical protein